MALIKCPDCGNDVSTRAVSCPNCGCVITDAEKGQAVEHLQSAEPHVAATITFSNSESDVPAQVEQCPKCGYVAVTVDPQLEPRPAPNPVPNKFAGKKLKGKIKDKESKQESSNWSKEMAMGGFILLVVGLILNWDWLGAFGLLSVAVGLVGMMFKKAADKLIDSIENK